jgi:hypothetical protein
MEGGMERLVGRFSLGLLAATSMLIAVPTGASAATQIGQTFIPSVFDCTGPSTYFQQATEPASPSYTVPAGGGVITSWQTQAVRGGAEVKFAAFRPTGTPSRFTTIGSSAMRTIQAIQLNTFSTQIPVQGGETIGLLIFSGTHQCARGGFGTGDTAQRDARAVHDTGSTFTYTDPSSPTRINVSANVEPDCDSDGLGDETQDTDLSSCFPPSFRCKGNLATITGSPQGELITGTTFRDVIVALAGNDRVLGLAGNDLICGNANRDTLVGGRGRDKLFGQKGRDTLKGKAGRDRLIGGKKKDFLKGGKGRDVLKGKGGFDICIGGPKPDVAKGCEVEKKI